jgi:hypothetical protein
LLNSDSEIARDRASSFILGLAGIQPASTPSVSLNLEMKAGYILDLRDDPPAASTLLGAVATGFDALAVEGWEFTKPPTCVVSESDPDHENFRRLKQGPSTLSPISKGGAGGGAVRRFWLDFRRKKVGRDWHHHSRALRHRSMGQGGMTGCRDYAPRQKSFLASCKYFGHG